MPSPLLADSNLAEAVFVDADLDGAVNPKSTPLELEAIVKQFKIPYLPIIDRALDKHNELQQQKAKELTLLTIDDLRAAVGQNG